MADNTIKTKKPMVKESVGAQYYAFNNPGEGVDYDSTKYEEEVTKTETVKNIGITENMETTTVKASGKDYMTVTQLSSVDIATEVVAVVVDDLSRMRGEVNTNGLIQSGTSNQRPYFAYGKVVNKVGGGKQYVWYPKCQLVENTDDIATREESFSEQNDTLTIRAYAFDKKGNVSNKVDTEASSFPTGLTEEMFFAKPIITPEDLSALVDSLTQSQQEGNDENIEGA